MKRSIKNLIIIAMILFTGVCSYFTMNDAKESSNNEIPNEVQDNIPQKGMQQNNNENSGVPENPSNSSNGNRSGNMEEPPEKPDENNNNKGESSKSGSSIRTIHYIMFGVEGVVESVLIAYLIMSKFNKLTFAETMGQSGELRIFVIVTIVITVILTIAQIFITQKAFVMKNNNTTNNSQIMGPGGMDSSSESVAQTGATEVDGETTTLASNYTTSNADESAILVENGGNAIVDGATVNKSSGYSSNMENSEFYGVNSGILVTKNSTATIKNATISTNAKGSNAVFSTGDISIENTEGTANSSQMVVIEGKNSATVTNSTLTASATCNRGDTDQAGIMIYQSMSGDAGEGTGEYRVYRVN